MSIGSARRHRAAATVTGDRFAERLIKASAGRVESFRTEREKLTGPIASVSIFCRTSLLIVLSGTVSEDLAGSFHLSATRTWEGFKCERQGGRSD